MAPKREISPPLPGDDRFGGDYSDARRAVLVRSDGAQKRSARRYLKDNEPVLPLLLVRQVEEFDRLRWERELVHRARLRNGGEGSSSAPPPALPPPEEYDPAAFGLSLAPEDFVDDAELDRTMALVKLLSKREAEEGAALDSLNEEINGIFLH